MPVSPNSRDSGDKRPQNAANSLGGSTGQDSHNLKHLSKNQRRNLRQRLRATLAKVREDAQLAGAIDTVPEGAVRSERVDPKKQSEQAQPKLIEQAIKQGWAVPDQKKPGLVQELIAIVEDKSEEASDKTKVAAFRALLAADQAQHERDNPQTKNNKSTVNVSVQTNIAAVDVLRQSMRSVDTTPPQITSEEEHPQ